MMNKLIEALDSYLGNLPGYYECGGGSMNRAHLRIIDLECDPKELIRAILTALKQPSETMLAAGEKLHPMGLEENSMRKYLHAMLDEAMK